jgi:hypothetical protein
VQPSRSISKGEYTITFQVWRPATGAEGSGCYNLVGEDLYADIDFGVGGLVDRILEPANYLTVQPGDVVGYYIIRKGRTGVEAGIQLEPRGEDEGEAVWYSGSNVPPTTGGAQECLFSASSMFTNSAPVLSVDAGKIELYTSMQDCY